MDFDNTQQVNALARQPFDPEPPKPERGLWRAAFDSVRGAGAKAMASALELGNVVGPAFVLKDDPANEQALEALKRPPDFAQTDLSKPFRDVERALRPDPATAGMAEQLVYGATGPIVSLVGSALLGGPVGLAAASAEAGFSQSEDLREQGVDMATRSGIGTLTAAATAATAFLPMAGPTLKATAGLYLAGGPGAFMAQQQATRAILEHADYNGIAKQYDPLDPMGLGMSALIPLPFAAHGALRNIRGAKGSPSGPESGPVAADQAPTGPTAPAEPAAAHPAAPQELVDAAMVHNLTLRQDAAENAAVVEQVLPRVPGEMHARDVLPPDLYNEASAVIAQHQAAEPSAPPLSPEQAQQASRELAPALDAAAQAKPAFDRAMTEIADGLGADVKLADVKGGGRLLEKHLLERPDTVPEGQHWMKDLVRGSIVVDKVADVPAALAAIGERFEITRVKDRFTNPLSTGYRDMLVNVRLPNGLEGEIQVHIPEMIAAKKVGHKIYDIERKLDDDQPDKAALQDLQSRIYAAALAGNEGRTSNLLKPSRSQAANSSRESGSPSSATLRPLGNGRVEPSLRTTTQEPSGSLATAAPSTSKNLAPSGSDAGFISTSDSIMGENPSGGKAAEVVTEIGSALKALDAALTGEPQAAAPAKAATDPLVRSVNDRVAAVEAQAPDMVVRTDEAGHPVTVAEELARVRREAAEGTDAELGALDADLLRVAADCALSMGSA